MDRSRLFYPIIALLGTALLMGCEKPAPATSATGAKPTTVVTSSGVQMVSLPGGQFTMGTSEGGPDEGPPHKVTVSPFLMDQYEVTHEMFEKVQLPDPSHWQDNPKGPVERVRWRDSKAYCNERSRLEGLTQCYDEKTPDWDCNYTVDGYRLPTEAEWEYAARGGGDGVYDFGSPDSLRQYAWYVENAEQKTHVVGQKKPNGFALYDMYGNVSEWCEDVFSTTYYGQSAPTDPTGPPNTVRNAKRVMRGGNWSAGAPACRATFRQGQRTGNTDACFATDFCGFRCVRRPTADELAKLQSTAK